ncbi:MAG: hypothetical protein ACRC6X_00135 [Culicoidibacterales bacterium]
MGDQYNSGSAAEEMRKEAEREQQRQEEELTSALNELESKGINLNVDMAGWSHAQKVEYLKTIKKTCEEFNHKGIATEKIPDFIMQSLKRGTIVGTQGTRAIYEIIYNGQKLRVAIEIGKNGFIVSANMRSSV